MRQIKYLRRAATALLGATMLFTSLPILALEDIGEWDLPGEKIIYVSPNGSDDGDGSEAKPIVRSVRQTRQSETLYPAARMCPILLYISAVEYISPRVR